MRISAALARDWASRRCQLAVLFCALLVALLIGGGVVYYLWGRSGTVPIASTGPPWFRDITAESGIDFVHDPGPIDGKFFMPQIVGSGCAVFAGDGDDTLNSIYLLNNGGPKGRPNVLYRKQADGTFRDASAGSGLDFAGHCMGVAIGDVNNDGLPDVAVTLWGGLRLFVNQGAGRFRQVEHSGIRSALWGTSACFFDYDRDGLLDLVVANYLDYDPAVPCPEGDGSLDYCHPKVFRGMVAKLFRNVTPPGGEPRFEDVTVASGLGRAPGPGLGVVCADFNGDGWPDILVANDAQANHLWINQKDRTFKEEAASRGLAFDGVGRPLANMGIALGDTRGTGVFDVFITHLPEETNTLWCQGPRGAFTDRTGPSRLSRPRWRATGFGTALIDFNRDGLLDIAIVNGRVVRRGGGYRPASHWDAYAERNQLFAGDGPGTFRDVSPDDPALCGESNVGRGLAIGDIDGDGAPDLVLSCAGGKARLLRNAVNNRGHWLLVRAIDPRYNRDAYGTEIIVEAGGRKWVSWVNPGQSYLSSNDPRAHFGMGDVKVVDTIRVLWPDGLRERFVGGPPDRVIVLRRGEGIAEPES